MASQARVALRPYNEASRTSAKVRPATNFIINDDIADNAFALRTQHLRAMGINSGRAAIIAGIAWGEVQR